MTKEREEHLIEMVEDNWYNIFDIIEEEQTDAVIDAAMDGHIWSFRYIKLDKMKTLDRCLKAVRCDGWMLKYVPDQMQTDEVIDAAMEDNPRAFRWIKDESKKTLKRCRKAVNWCGQYLAFVPEELRERVMNIDEERENELIAKIKENCDYLGQISKHEQTDRVIDAAMDIDAFSFVHIKDEKKKTYERCLRAVERNEFVIKYIPKEFKDRVKEELGLS